MQKFFLAICLVVFGANLVAADRPQASGLPTVKNSSWEVDDTTRLIRLKTYPQSFFYNPYAIMGPDNLPLYENESYFKKALNGVVASAAVNFGLQVSKLAVPFAKLTVPFFNTGTLLPYVGSTLGFVGGVCAKAAPLTVGFTGSGLCFVGCFVGKAIIDVFIEYRMWRAKHGPKTSAETGNEIEMSGPAGQFQAFKLFTESLSENAIRLKRNIAPAVGVAAVLCVAGVLTAIKDNRLVLIQK